MDDTAHHRAAAIIGAMGADVPGHLAAYVWHAAQRPADAAALLALVLTAVGHGRRLERLSAGQDGPPWAEVAERMRALDRHKQQNARLHPSKRRIQP